jgi:hypothetical protein
VQPTGISATSSPGPALRCDVLAHAALTIPLDEIAGLRRKPGPGVGESLPNNFLKHSDEQSVVGLASVLHAIAAAGLDHTMFANWGIVAAPCFLGRGTLVGAMARYAVEGAWGMSPHFIPHKSQHALSGTISQALKIRGPNFGTGGAPCGAAEAMLAGAVMVGADGLPGVWVVMTAWDPEYVPDAEGRPVSPVNCLAVALALVLDRSAHSGFRLHVQPGAAAGGSARPPLKLRSLFDLLQTVPGSTPPLVWELDGGIVLQIGREMNARLALELKPHAWSKNRAPQAIMRSGAGTENQW